MRKKLRLVLLLKLLLLLCISAYALTVNTDKTQYLKGEVIKISGDCKTELETKLTASLEEKIIFEEFINCSAGGSYIFEYATSYLDPAGNWLLVLSNKEERITKRAVVNPTSESAFYLIAFLSPTEGKYKRVEDIIISVRVTDAGIPVRDANLITWGPDGKKYYFENSGEGLYNLEYEIPYNGKLGDWELLVLAQSQRNGTFFGGVNSLTLELVKAPIAIEVVEPEIHSYELIQKIPIKLNISYFNGKPIKEEIDELSVVAIIGRKNIQLEKTEEGAYELLYEPEMSEIGSLVIRINALDDAGNDGVKVIDLVVTCSIACLLIKYGLYIIVFIVVLIIILSLFSSRIKYHLELRMLENEKKKTMDLIKSLQEEYFGGRVMPSKSYNRNLAQYKSRIAELDEKIKRLKEEGTG